MVKLSVVYNHINKINDTFVATVSGLDDGSYIRWYYRKGTTISELETSTPIIFREMFKGTDEKIEYVKETESSSSSDNLFLVLDRGTDSIIEFTRTFTVGQSTDSLDNYELLNGYYYQIGISYTKDGSNIIWSDSRQVYNKFPSIINAPVITSTYSLREYTVVSVPEAKFVPNTYYIYENNKYVLAQTFTEGQTYYLKTRSGLNYNYYYKDKFLKLNWTRPDIPDGLASYWYQIQYIVDVMNPTETNKWQNYGDGYFQITQSSPQNIEIDEISAGLTGKSIRFRIVIYDSSEGVYNITSNISNYLYKIKPSTFLGKAEGVSANLSVSIATHPDGYRNSYLRPSRLSKEELRTITVTALTTSNIRPVFNAPDGNIYYQDFRYEIWFSYNGITQKIQDGIVPEISGDTQQYNLLYNDLTHNNEGTGVLNKLIYGDPDSKLIGPYSAGCFIKYYDIYDQVISTTSTNIIIDFREAPKGCSNICFGRDGLISPSATTSVTYKNSNFNYFPLNPAPNEARPDNPSDIILSNENYIIAFIPGNKSYEAEKTEKRKYQIQIYELSNFSHGDTISEIHFQGKPLYEAIIRSNQLLDGSIFGKTNEYKSFIVNAGIFAKTTYLGVRIYSIDGTSDAVYEKNTSANVICNNYLIGAKLSQPKIEITLPEVTSDITTSEDILDYKNHVTIIWPNDYEEFHQFHRNCIYNQPSTGTITYEPYAELFVEYSESLENFEEKSQSEFIQSDKFYYKTLGGIDEDGNILANYPDINIKLKNYRRVFTRIKIDYYTGLELIGNLQIIPHKISIYSNIVINYLQIPTISERPHSIGVNDERVYGANTPDTYQIIQLTSETFIPNKYYTYDKSTRRHIIALIYNKDETYYERIESQTKDMIVASIREYKNGKFEKTKIRLSGTNNDLINELIYDLSTGKLTNGESQAESQLFATLEDIRNIGI